MTISLGVPEVEGAQPRIAIVGIGGGGCNGVNSMVQDGMPGVNFITCDTDGQHLSQTTADWRIQLGRDSTGGYGAGTNPEIGRQAAEESVDSIRAALSGMSLAFLAAGMGGGTGSGALPVMARLLRELGVLTVGVVTKPFNYEGVRRMEVAVESIKQSAEHLDTLLVISNQNLFQAGQKKVTFANALSRVDEVLHESVRGMVDLVVRPGIINMDFADLCMALQDGGPAVIGMGEASGANRGVEAALAAARNPLLDGIKMDGAKALLVNVTGGGDLELKDVDDAANHLRNKAHFQARVKVGAASDPEMEGKVRVYIIATGIAGRAGQMEKGRDEQPMQTKNVTPSPEAVTSPAVSGIAAANSASLASSTPHSAPTPQEARQAADSGLWSDSISIDSGSIAKPAAAARRQQATAAQKPSSTSGKVLPLGSRVRLGAPLSDKPAENSLDEGERRPAPAPAKQQPVRCPTDTGRGLLSRILSTG